MEYTGVILVGAERTYFKTKDEMISYVLDEGLVVDKRVVLEGRVWFICHKQGEEQ